MKAGIFRNRLSGFYETIHNVKSSISSKVATRFMLTVGLVIAILLAFMFLFIYNTTQDHIISEVNKQATIAHEQIVITRYWNTIYGGIYVEKTEGVVSNPYLRIVGIEPDITTSDNRTFTLKNPALMTRELSAIASHRNILEFHITSLDPINPSNAPDEFEKESLLSFKNGSTESSQIVKRNDTMYFQYIAPLYVTESCLKCHKNFNTGDIGGGISVFLPMENAYASILTTRNNLLGAGIILIIGVEILLFFLIRKHIVHPIQNLTVGAKKMGDGDLEYRISPVNDDEIGILSTTFNNMASDISHLYESVRNQAADLEKQMEISRFAENNLKKQNEFINLVIDSLPHPFYVINIKDYIITMANAAAPANWEGSTCYAISHNRTSPCDDDEHKCPLEEIKISKKPVTMEHLHYDINGLPKNIEVHCYPIFDKKGNVNQLIEYSIDITDKKLAEEMLRESEEKYRMLYESLSDAIILLEENNIIDCNNATLQIFGYSKKEDFLKIHPKDISPSYQPDGTDSESSSKNKISETFRKGTSQFEWVFKKQNGTEFFADVVLKAFNFKGKQIMHATVRDITMRKATEDELYKYKVHLEDLVRKRTEELEKKNAKLQKFNKLFVGRELRMIELKKLIAEYETKIAEIERKNNNFSEAD